jgi:lipoprotein-anchoring transpeptidase ErfK/SrfK
MRVRFIAIPAAAGLMLAGGTGAVYAYDHGKQNVIAAGVRVNGVAVGGLTPAQAEAKLNAALLKPLARPVTARYHGRTFTLTPAKAAVAIDVHGTVAAALERSQRGNMFSRSWRNARGKAVDADLAAKLSWSRPAIDALVARVSRAINRSPRDASVDLETGKVDPTRSRTGLNVHAATLAAAIEKTLLDPGARAPVSIRASVREPKLSTEQLAAKYPAVIVVDRGRFKLTLYKHLKKAKTYSVAVGQVGLETPAGLYHVQNKAIDPAWHVPNSAWAGDLAGKVIPAGDPGNPIKARWLGIFDGAGIHGTSEDGSIGYAASHGCVRMHIADVEELYPQVPVGAPVYIA